MPQYAQCTRCCSRQPELSTTVQLPNLQNILRQSYNNATVTIDLRLTYKNLQSCKIVCDSVRKLAYDIPALLKLRPYGATQICLLLLYS